MIVDIVDIVENSFFPHKKNSSKKNAAGNCEL